MPINRIRQIISGSKQEETNRFSFGETQKVQPTIKSILDRAKEEKKETQSFIEMINRGAAKNRVESVRTYLEEDTRKPFGINLDELKKPTLGSTVREFVEGPTIPYFSRRFFANFEDYVLGASALFGQGGARVFKSLGRDDIAARFDDAAKQVVSDDFGWLSPDVKKERQERAEATANMGLAASILNTTVEAGLDVYALMKSMALLNPAGAKTILQPYLVKAGVAVEKAGKIGSAIERAATLGAFRFAGTRSLDMTERAQNAAWMVAYNVTPYVAVGSISKLPMNIVKKIPGSSLGTKAFFSDVILNTALTSSVYKQLGDEYGWFSQEFLSEAIPQLIMDVGMAWSTRNYPLYDRDRQTMKLAENISKMEHAERGGDLKQTTREKYELLKSINNIADNHDRLYASAQLSSKYGDLRFDDKGDLTIGSIRKIQTETGLNVFNKNPEEMLTTLIYRGEKFTEDSPIFRTDEQIARLNEQTPEANKVLSKDIIKLTLTERFNRFAKDPQIGFSIKDVSNKIEELHKEGFSRKEIADQLRIEESSVQNVFNQKKLSELEIGETIKDKIISTHFEKTKEDYTDFVKILKLDKMKIDEMAKTGFEYTQKNPSDAFKIAYDMKDAPPDIPKQVIQMNVIERLKAEGKMEQAATVSLKLSETFTRLAQELNLAKLDLSSSGEQTIISSIIQERLTNFGKKIPKGAGEKRSPEVRALDRIKNEAVKAAENIKEELKPSFEKTSVGLAEGVLTEVKAAPNVQNKIIGALRKENVTINDLYNMGDSGRKTFFERFTTKDDATKLNMEFEKAMLSTQKQTISSWVWRNIYKGKPLYNEISIDVAKQMYDYGLRAAKLKKVSSENRIKTLSKYVGSNIAKKLNERFEQSIKTNRLADWEQKTIGSKELYENKKISPTVAKIEALNDIGLLTPKQTVDFMKDLVSSKLGITITREEAAKISELSKKQSELQQKIGDDWTWKNKENIKEFFRTKKETTDYLKKINPDPAIEVFTGIGARGAMLFSLRSATNSLVYQVLPGIERAVAKRLTSAALLPGDFKFVDRLIVTFSGMKDLSVSKFWKEQTKMGIEIYKETRYDISRLVKLDDGFKYFGEKFTTPQGPTWGESKGVAEKIGATIRGHARFVQPALKYAAGGTDAVFGNSQRAGTTIFLANQQARLEERSNTLPEGMTREQRVADLEKQACGFNPKDVAAQYIREMGLIDANRANFTENAFWGEATIKLRNLLPKGIGMTIAPFAKIPANALGRGFEYSGPGFILGARKIFNATKMDDGPTKNIEIAEGVAKIIMTTGAIGGATLLTSLLNNDDYIGPYDYTKRNENALSATKNAGSGYVRFGGTWVNLRWLGPLGIGIIAQMEARKSAEDGEIATIGYAQGMIRGLLDLPVTKEIYGAMGAIERATRTKIKSALLNTLGLDVDSIKSWARSRTIPSIINVDVLNLIKDDEYDSLGRVKPKKTLANFFIGSNVKEDTSNQLTREFDRLSGTGNLPTLSEPTGINMEWLDFVAARIDSDLNIDFMNEIKRNYANESLKLINTSNYQKMKPSEQKAEIDKIRRKEMLDEIRKRAETLKKEIPAVYFQFQKEQKIEVEEKTESPGISPRFRIQ